MKRFSLSILAVLLLFVAACQPSNAPTPQNANLCGNGICEGAENPTRCPADCQLPETTTPAPPLPSTEVAPSEKTGNGVLYLGIMVHLEGWDDGQNEEKFQRHAALLREYADLFEEYGGLLTLESKEFTDGIQKWGDNVLLEMEERGHGIGVHADVGGTKGYDCNQFANDLRAKKTQLESLGVTVRHVSGVVSTCDWVSAAADAGYLFVTGVVAYGVMSMPPDARPPEFRNCPNPAACHQPYPPNIADRLRPWRVNDGLSWTTPTPNGRLVLLPTGGELNCLEEETRSSQSETRCKFTEEDVDIFFQQLDEALSYTDPNLVNIYYVAWSFGKSLDKKIMEDWLRRLRPYIASGRVEWKTLPQMYDAYIQWERTHP